MLLCGAEVVLGLQRRHANDTPFGHALVGHNQGDSRLGSPQERTAGDPGSGHQQGRASNLSSLSPFDAASSLVSVAKGSLVSEPSVDRSQEAWLDRAPDQHVAYDVKGPRSCVRRFEGCAHATRSETPDLARGRTGRSGPRSMGPSTAGESQARRPGEFLIETQVVLHLWRSPWCDLVI